MKPMVILGIETSCDDSAAAIYHSQNGLLANIISTQTIHDQHGGIVPELASRDHIRNLLPTIKYALSQAQLTKKDITAIAYTAGPGLSGSLMVGAGLAKSLAWSLKIPSLAINHLEGHILSSFIENSELDFPFLALLVSGGHTQLIHAHALGRYSILGQTLDDAAGEAFDKVAKMIGLGFPGGAKLSALAAQGKDRFKFALPMAKKMDLNFSFSGLKTKVYYLLQKQPVLDYQFKADLACSFQKVAIDSLINKTLVASKQTGLKKIVIAGGVSANSLLREKLFGAAKEQNLDLFYASLPLCTDNAAMIAYTGYRYYQAAAKPSLHNLAIQVHPKWPLNDNRAPLKTSL